MTRGYIKVQLEPLSVETRACNYGCRGDLSGQINSRAPSVFDQREYSQLHVCFGSPQIRYHWHSRWSQHPRDATATRSQIDGLCCPTFYRLLHRHHQQAYGATMASAKIGDVGWPRVWLVFIAV